MVQTDELTQKRLNAELSARGCSIPVCLFNSIDSTNLEAKRRLAAGDASPELIIAREQTAGRGRLGRSFFSPADTGLYMTLKTEAPKTFPDITLLTIAAAAAVSGAIETLTDVRASIKWVNDIYVDGRKTCGILAESVIMGAHTGLAIGIGVNVRTKVFPEKLQGIAGSLNRETDRNALAAEITSRLLSIFENPDASEYMDEYRARSFVPGKRISYQMGGIKKEGLALSVEDDGALCVLLENGGTERLRYGEVSVRTDDE